MLPALERTTGRKIRITTMIDEFSRTCLDNHCTRCIGANEVIVQLTNAGIVHGIPKYIRSDNESKFMANLFAQMTGRHRHQNGAYITLDSPWKCEKLELS